MFVYGWVWMLGFAVISSRPGMLELGHEIALPLVLTEHPEARMLTRQKGVSFKMNGFVVFLNPMAPHKMCFLSTLNTLVKASWMQCCPYLHSAWTCLLSLYLNSLFPSPSPLPSPSFMRGNYNTALPLISIWGWTVLYMQRLTCASQSEPSKAH